MARAPAVSRSVNARVERCTAEFVPVSQRRLRCLQDHRDDVGVAVKAGAVERRRLMDAFHTRIESHIEHESYRLRPIPPRRRGHDLALGVTQPPHQSRISSQFRPRPRFIRVPQCIEKALLRGSVLEQDRRNSLVAELARHIGRRQIEPQGPSINVSAWTGERRLVDMRFNLFGIVKKCLPEQVHVAQAGDRKDIHRGAAFNQSPRDHFVFDVMLKRRGIVVGIARVDMGPAIQEKVDRFERRREMQQRFTIATLCMNQVGRRLELRLEAVDHSEYRRGPGRHRCPAIDERLRFRQRKIPFKDAEAACPEGRARIDIRAIRLQYIDQRQVLLGLMNGRRIEVCVTGLLIAARTAACF